MVPCSTCSSCGISSILSFVRKSTDAREACVLFGGQRRAAGLMAHLSDLQHPQPLPPMANPLAAEEGGARRLEADGDHDQHHQRQEHGQQQEGHDDIESANRGELEELAGRRSSGLGQLGRGQHGQLGGRQSGDLVVFRRRGCCFPSSTEAHEHRSPEAECFRSGKHSALGARGGGLYRGGPIDRISNFADPPRLRTRPFMELARSHGVRTTCVNEPRASARRRGSGHRLRRFILPVSRCTATGRLMTTATVVQ